MKRLLISTLLLGAVPLAALAETAYVTDQLRLGLHRAADTSDRAFRTLESGQEMEVLSQNRNYAQVRLPDGTVGYVKAAFIIAEKPATLVVAETRTENERLAAELERAKAQFAAPAAAIAALEQQAAEQQAALTASAARIEELEEANERYASRQAQYAYSLPLAWVAGAMLLCLIGGVLAGMWWLDWRSRRRHGGIRVY
jgi:SH3 domain protein